MTSEESWALMFDDHKMPCFLAHKNKNKEIFYVNNELVKIIGAEDVVVGQNYFSALASKNFAIMGNVAPDWDFSEPVSVEVFSKSMNLGFHCTFALIPQTDIIFCLMRPISGNESDGFTFEDNLSKCIAVVQQDQAQKCLDLLKILGEFYNADKAYLYLVERRNMKIPCASSWTRHENIEVTADLSTKLEVKKLLDWFETRNEAGIIDTARAHKSFCQQSIEAEVLNAYELDNVVMSVVEDSKH